MRKRRTEDVRLQKKVDLTKRDGKMVLFLTALGSLALDRQPTFTVASCWDKFQPLAVAKVGFKIPFNIVISMVAVSESTGEKGR